MDMEGFLMARKLSQEKKNVIADLIELYDIKIAYVIEQTAY